MNKQIEAVASSASSSRQTSPSSPIGHELPATPTSASSHHHYHSHQSSQQQQHQQHPQNPNFDSNVISERVKNLATQIYQELKRIISRCNYDNDIVSGLMPLIVRVLESLDLALIENQQLQVDLELCRDDNEQLVVMFEKEKAAKRAIDKKLIETEYANEEERQQYQQKIESLDNVVKMMELKAKNASDQATRLEEKEVERKKEYQKLHDRYTELLKSHCDVVERVRHLVSNNEVSNLSSINVPQQLVANSITDLSTCDPPVHQLSKMRLRVDEATEVRDSCISAREPLKSWNAETELTLEDASLVVIEDVLETGSHKSGPTNFSSSHNESDKTASETDGGEHEKESENDSIAYTSMEKEFRKLIQDNKDLLNTKNALNVVKDDLIAEVDRLTNEVTMYEQAVEQLNSTKEQMKHKVSTVDAELRKTKEELEKAKQKIRENNEEGVPYSQRKRFGRAEMAKVLMERNEYKEKYMELQDAVRYTELVRANKSEGEKRSGLWKFFSNLFGAPPLAIGAASQMASRNSSSLVSYLGSPTLAIGFPEHQQSGQSNSAEPANSETGGAVLRGSIMSINQRLTSNSDMIVLMDSDLNIDRSRASSRDGSSRFMNSASSGYIHAYGWSLPISSFKNIVPGINSEPNVAISDGASETITADSGVLTSKSLSLQVSIPLYCRPLTGDSFGMKIWCATAIDLGGELAQITTDDKTEEVLAIDSPNVSESSGSVVNITSTPVKSPNRSALKQLEEEVDQALRKSHNSTAEITTDGTARSQSTIRASSIGLLKTLPNEEPSSCVWICSTQHSRSKITIIDIKTKPNELLDSFHVPTFLYCIKSIPGCKSNDLLGLKMPICSDPNQSTDQPKISTLNLIEQLVATQKREFYRLVKVDPEMDSKAIKRLEAKRNSAREGERSDSQDAIIEKSLDQEAREATEISTKTVKSQPTDDAEISRILDNDVSAGIATLQKLNDFVAHTQPQNEASETIQGPRHSTPSKDQAESYDNSDDRLTDGYQPISTHLPTVWMGGKNSILYVHSAIGQWKDFVAGVKLSDSILQIFHHRGRVFVALADGSLCVFFRNLDTKQWDFTHYLLIDVGLLSEAASELSSDLNEPPSPSDSSEASRASFNDNEPLSLSEQLRDATAKEAKSFNQMSYEPKSKSKTRVAGIRCLELANKNLWIGYRNQVLIIDPVTLKLKHSFSLVPQQDNQVRQLVAMKDGVFCCLRSDLILRLYSSLKPYQHIQNIDIEPVVTRLLSPRSFVISHITAMRVAGNTLWIGNAHGIIIAIPCTMVSQISEAPIPSPTNDMELVQPESLTIARYVPKCDINCAQISFHGHKDAVKFFIHSHNLMLSGGQGYVDFRLDMDDQSKSINDKSHLILWQLPSQENK